MPATSIPTAALIPNGERFTNMTPMETSFRANGAVLPQARRSPGPLLGSAGNPCAAGQFAGATASMAGITLTNSGPANTYDTMVARLSAGAPEIVLQPQSQTVSVSPLSPPVNATFSVTAWGAAPLNFRWWFNGTNLLAGATNAVLSFTNVQPTNAGGYSVILSNASGSLTSQVATLTVTTPPPITMQPQSQTVASGTNVFFTVTASGNHAT